MNKRQDFSRDELLTTIEEAEELARKFDTVDVDHGQMRLIYRWAEMADTVALLMVQAEERLSPEELRQIQATVNAQDETRWNNYRRNIRWLNKPTEE